MQNIVDGFEGRLKIVDLRSLPVADEIESELLASILREADFYFRFVGEPLRQGNLSIVADQVRLFQHVLSMGVFADCDVEFDDSLDVGMLRLPAPSALLRGTKTVGGTCQMT